MNAPRFRSVAVRIAFALALGAAIGVGIFLWTGAPGPSSPPSGPDAGRVSEPTTVPTPDSVGGAATDDGTADDGPADDAQDGRPDDDAPDGSAGEPGANRPGIEAAPEPEESPRPPGAVGPLPERPDLDVPSGPRAPVSAVDALVDGFPTRVITVAAGSNVLSSSVSSDGGRLQASLEATSGRSVAEVMDHYTELFRDLGFTWSAADATVGGTAFSFTRDGHSVVVSARPQAEGSLYTVFGILDQES